MTEGVSRESLLSDSSLLDYKLLMSELRASADEAAWTPPLSSVHSKKTSFLLRNLLLRTCNHILVVFPWKRVYSKSRQTSKTGREDIQI